MAWIGTCSYNNIELPLWCMLWTGHKSHQSTSSEEFNVLTPMAVESSVFYFTGFFTRGLMVHSNDDDQHDAMENNPPATVSFPSFLYASMPAMNAYSMALPISLTFVTASHVTS
jgi:hypothetical protein